MKRISALLVAGVVLLLVFTQCGMLDKVAQIEENASPIYYEVVENYFVRNDVECTKLQKLIFNNQSEFEAVFGTAAAMGNLPSGIDWKQQYVLVVILPETNTSTTVSPLGVKQNGNSVIFNYKVTRGNKTSYTMIPFAAVALDKPASAQKLEFYFLEK